MILNLMSERIVNYGKDFLNYFCNKFGFNLAIFETLSNSPVFIDGRLNEKLYEIYCKNDSTNYYVISLKGTYKLYFVNSQTNAVFPKYGIDGVVNVNGEYVYTKFIYGVEYAFSFQPLPKLCVEFYNEFGEQVSLFDGKVQLVRKQKFTSENQYYVVKSLIDKQVKTLVYDENSMTILFELDFDYSDFEVCGYLVESGVTYYLLDGQRLSTSRHQVVIFDGKNYFSHADPQYSNLIDKIIDI